LIIANLAAIRRTYTAHDNRHVFRSAGIAKIARAIFHIVECVGSISLYRDRTHAVAYFALAIAKSLIVGRRARWCIGKTTRSFDAGSRTTNRVGTRTIVFRRANARSTHSAHSTGSAHATGAAAAAAAPSFDRRSIHGGYDLASG